MSWKQTCIVEMMLSPSLGRAPSARYPLGSYLDLTLACLLLSFPEPDLVAAVLFLVVSLIQLWATNYPLYRNVPCGPTD